MYQTIRDIEVQKNYTETKYIFQLMSTVEYIFSIAEHRHYYEIIN